MRVTTSQTCYGQSQDQPVRGTGYKPSTLLLGRVGEPMDLSTQKLVGCWYTTSGHRG